MSKQKQFIHGKIEEQEMAALCTDHMKIFGANINLMRYLPMANDGLKPGERRIIYAMHNDLKLAYNKKFTKVAQITGQALLYHPHGETPVSDTIGRLGQSWNNLQCLIDKQGNFGSPMGDPVGSARYIEARLTYYTHKCFFEDFDPNVCDMTDNYLGDRKEPLYLPTRYPHLLISGSFGIGYGLVTGIPFYNFKEVCNLAIEMIKDPNYSEYTLYPDSPTNSDIIDEGQFSYLSNSGKGKYKSRGRIILDKKNHALVIRSTPHLTTWNKIKARILEINTETPLGIVNIDDYSDESGIRVIIYIKQEKSLAEVRNIIYRSTDMEKVFPVDMKMIHNQTVVDFSIPTAMSHWIHTRRAYKRRLINNKIVKLREREHILKILLFVTNKNNAERTIKIIKSSESRDEAVKNLVAEYRISSLQAGTIADMRMSAFSKDSCKRYEKEKKEVTKEADELETISRSKKKIDKLIIAELEEGIELFGEERRSEIIPYDGNNSTPDTNHLVLMTAKGKLKKLPMDINHMGAFAKGDYPLFTIKTNNLKDLLCFDEFGKVSRVSVSSIPSTEISSEGDPISRYIKPKGRVISIMEKPDNSSKDQYIVSVSKNGFIKKTSLDEYMNIRNELIAASMKDGDSIQSVFLVTQTKTKSIMLYTNTGKAIRIVLKDISPTARSTMGIKGFKLSSDEFIIGSNIVSAKDEFVFILTEKGHAKRIKLEDFKAMKKREDAIKIISLGLNDYISIVRSVSGEETIRVYMTNSDAIDVYMGDVKVLPKLSKANKLIPVRKGDFIADVHII